MSRPMFGSSIPVSPSRLGVIHSEGIRFRAAGGYGQYSYSDAAPDGQSLTFHAQTHFTDVLMGYQTRFGELTAKAFIGASLISHDIAPLDEETLFDHGSEVGVKGVLEFWLNMGQKGWGSLDLLGIGVRDAIGASSHWLSRLTHRSHSVSKPASMSIHKANAACRIRVRRGLPHHAQ